MCDWPLVIAVHTLYDCACHIPEGSVITKCWTSLCDDLTIENIIYDTGASPCNRRPRPRRLWSRDTHPPNPAAISNIRTGIRIGQKSLPELLIDSEVTVQTLTLVLPVHLIPRQRILLRDRRGLPDRQIQPHGPQHGSDVLSVCLGSRHGRLRHGSRRRHAGADREERPAPLRSGACAVHCYDQRSGENGTR